MPTDPAASSPATTQVSADLVPALQRLVLRLEDDLRGRVEGEGGVAVQDGVRESWRAEHEQALKAERTSASWQQWRDERITQAAVGWVLLTVFARYCEDNRLVTPRWIAGADDGARRHALDSRGEYFRTHPERTDREWLGEIVAHFAGIDATAGLVDEFSPIHLVAPSGDAAREVLEFWWDRDDDGALKWTFTGADTRFLGDVYQDLSESARKTYALLQTPEFVEEFILDQTLTPALDEQARAGRPLDEFTIIDPTCGSGHFLLGAFHRLHAHWQEQAPALEPRVLVGKALGAVFGVDINPFAVAIARFRLIVAALQASGDDSLETMIDLDLNLAAGDSLLWGASQQVLGDGLWDTAAGGELPASATENARLLKAILQERRHDVVVGNPPYITVKDKALNQTYRQLYTTCKGTYALTVPFMELFFDLAKTGDDGNPVGWTGQITSNSFMKREFGTKVIEELLARKDLTRVIDTSGAYIPGHGTPTVILVGRNQAPAADVVRAVMGIRGEPGRPEDHARGIVWSSIVDHIDQPGFDDGWVSIDDLDRGLLAEHPWNLQGGGAVELTAAIEKVDGPILDNQIVGKIGFASFPGADDAFFAPHHYFVRQGWSKDLVRQLILGEYVRDWDLAEGEWAFVPYRKDAQIIAEDRAAGWYRRQWGLRSTLGAVTGFGGQTTAASGRPWWSWYRWVPARYETPLSITFAFVATHNHFVLDRGGKVFKQSAPVIKLPEGASLDEHLRLLGVLNSSVACFWLKQNSHNKGRPGAEAAGADEPWEHRFEFTGTTLQDFPLPAVLPVGRARLLDDLATELAGWSPAAVVAREVPTWEGLGAARAEFERVRAQMVAVQEELDWETYRLYGLIDEDLTYSGDLPGIGSAERAFAIDLARQVRDEGVATSWFTHHNHLFAPVTEIPAHWPEDYRTLVQQRLDLIAENKQIRLLEKPEYKRRWAVEPWDKQVTVALRDWLLDRVEARELWHDADGYPVLRSVGQLADILDRDADFRSVLRLWAGTMEAATEVALAKLLAPEGVPYLAAWRYKPSGLRKRQAWEDTWALQRREDAGEVLDGPIPVPPKYTSADFRKPSFWSHRGKLDVPKERFISYPGAERESDASELLGWAGWDHGQQALALAALVGERIDDGWEAERLTPLLAGLAELLPWVRQWHDQIDPEFGESIADTIATELQTRSTELGLTSEDLAAWRPPAPTRGRRRKTSP